MSTQDVTTSTPKPLHISASQKIGKSLAFVVLGLCNVFMIGFGVGAGVLGATIVVSLFGHGWVLVYITGAIILSSAVIFVGKKIGERAAND